MRKVDILHTPPVFGIIASVGSPKKVRRRNTLRSLSGYIALALLVLGILAIACIGPIYAYTIVKLIKLVVFSLLPGSLLLLATLIHRRFTTLNRFEKGHPDAGNIQVGFAGIKVSRDGKEDLSFPFEAIGRLEVYYYAGITSGFLNKRAGFNTIPSVRVDIRVGHSVWTFLVKNYRKEDNSFGNFYRCMHLLRRDNPRMQKKIQLWNMY